MIAGVDGRCRVGTEAGCMRVQRRGRWDVMVAMKREVVVAINPGVCLHSLSSLVTPGEQCTDDARRHTPRHGRAERVAWRGVAPGGFHRCYFRLASIPIEGRRNSTSPLSQTGPHRYYNMEAE